MQAEKIGTQQHREEAPENYQKIGTTKQEIAQTHPNKEEINQKDQERADPQHESLDTKKEMKAISHQDQTSALSDSSHNNTQGTEDSNRGNLSFTQTLISCYHFLPSIAFISSLIHPKKCLSFSGEQEHDHTQQSTKTIPIHNTQSKTKHNTT